MVMMCNTATLPTIGVAGAEQWFTTEVRAAYNPDPNTTPILQMSVGEVNTIK